MVRMIGQHDLKVRIFQSIVECKPSSESADKHEYRWESETWPDEWHTLGQELLWPRCSPFWLGTSFGPWVCCIFSDNTTLNEVSIHKCSCYCTKTGCHVAIDCQDFGHIVNKLIRNFQIQAELLVFVIEWEAFLACCSFVQFPRWMLMIWSVMHL